jgi:RNA polymerase sigma factor (sigma-70 family)
MSQPHSIMEDFALIRAAQAGDALAMSRLLDDLAPYVSRICCGIAIHSGPDAAQEALIQIFRDLASVREPRALRGWARRIATREAIRHAKRERRHAGGGTDGEGGRDVREIPAPGDASLDVDVRAVLSELQPDQRAILVLRDLEGLSEVEAARQLEVAKGTAKSRLHRARTAFLERWKS